MMADETVQPDEKRGKRAPGLRFVGIRYETRMEFTREPDPHPDIVLGQEREVAADIAKEIQNWFDREFMKALTPSATDVTPNVLPASEDVTP